jgi:hypothetical protein
MLRDACRAMHPLHWDYFPIDGIRKRQYPATSLMA